MRWRRWTQVLTVAIRKSNFPLMYQMSWYLFTCFLDLLIPCVTSPQDVGSHGSPHCLINLPSLPPTVLTFIHTTAFGKLVVLFPSICPVSVLFPFSLRCFPYVLNLWNSQHPSVEPHFCCLQFYLHLRKLSGIHCHKI